MLRYLIFLCLQTGVQMAGPTFTTEPPRWATFSNSTGLELKCKAAGDPQPDIGWRKKANLTVPVRDVAGLRYFRSDGSLVFPPFAPDDYRQEVHSDTYVCVASSTRGSIVSRDVQVKAVLDKEYIPQVFDEYVIRGNTAVLRCNLPPNIREYATLDTWTRNDGLILKNSVSRGAAYTVLPTGELLVHEVTDRRSRWTYQCKTQHRLTGGIIESRTAGKVVVTEPRSEAIPRIIFSQSQVTVVEGQTAYLSCVAQSHPAASYSWLKEESSGLVTVRESERVEQLHALLVVRRTSKEDGGKYACVVKNRLGEKRAETSLTVTAPLFVQIQPHLQLATPEDSVFFNCTIGGYPVQRVLWKKDKIPIVPNNRIKVVSKSLLHITSVRRTDEGMYQCFAYNDRDGVQNTAELRIREMAPSLVKTFDEKTIQPSESISLKCVANGNPVPHITWKLDHFGLAQNSRVARTDHVTSQGHVISYVNISDVSVEDSGEYRCEAANSVGSVNHEARLNVYGAPFIRHMSNISAISGETLTIKCPYGGFPIDVVSWQKDDIRLPLNSRQQVDLGGTLTIQDVRRAADEGKYTCIVKNGKGQTATKTILIEVVVAPLIDSHFFPETISADEGSRTKVICVVTTGDPPIRFHWLKNGFPFSAYGDVSVQVTEDSSIITFRTVSFNDLGQYTCVASNQAASNNMTMQLIVNVPPRWREEPKNVSVMLGHSVWINCSAAGYPVPKVSWRKVRDAGQGSVLFVGQNSKIHQHTNGTLVIQDTEEDDHGQYLCQVSNGIGAGLSKMVFIHIKVPPKFEETYGNYVVTEGKTASLKCVAKGHEPMVITWRKNKEPLPLDTDMRMTIREVSEGKRISSELVIAFASRTDSAVYTCEASNEYGTDDSTVELVVQGVPDPPSGISSNTTSRLIRLHWEVPHNGNSRITGSVVQYQSKSGHANNRLAQLVVSGSETTATLRGLTPVTTYHIRIIAENALGRSRPSETVDVTTGIEAPAAPPSDVRVLSSGAQSLKVTWSEPPPEMQHGKIKGYYVGYKVIDTTDPYEFQHVDTNADQEEYFSYLTSLHPFTEYAVIVQAYNKAGPGPHSEPVMGITLDTAPPTSPTVQVASTTETVIRITWKRDANDMTTVSEYTLYYRREKGSWTKKTFDGKADRFVINGLECGTQYELYMTSTNSIGTGEPSAQLVAKTKGGAPISPSKEEFIDTNSTFVTLNMKAWQSGGCPITKFSIKYKLRYQRQWTVISNLIENNQGQLVLGPLSPDREYSLLVAAHSEAGNTEEEYHFKTSYSSALVSEEDVVPFYHSMSFFLPVIISALLLVLIIICVIVMVRRHARSRANHQDFQSRKSGVDSLIMKDISERRYIENLSSPHYVSTMPANNNDAESSLGEYSELYSAFPPAYHVASKTDLRSPADQQRNTSERMFATIKRYPPRPAAYKQGIDALSGHQMAPQDRED